MISSLARFGGLTATVYSTLYDPVTDPAAIGTRVTSILEDNVVDFSVASGQPLPSLSANTGIGTWRWQGFIQPSKAAQYTFYVAVKHTSEGCKENQHPDFDLARDLKNPTMTDYKRYYTQKELDIVWKLYENVFNEFGYQREFI